MATSFPELLFVFENTEGREEFFAPFRIFKSEKKPWERGCTSWDKVERIQCKNNNSISKGFRYFVK